MLKLPAMLLCLGQPLVTFFILLLYLYLLMSFILLLLFSLLFDIIPHPSVDYCRGFYAPFCTLSPVHRRVIRDTLIFNHSVISLLRALRIWVGIFNPQAFFTLRSFPNVWHNLLLSRPPREPAVYPWNLQGFILILKTQTWSISLFDSQ